MGGRKVIKDLITKQGIMIDITNACVNQCGNCMRFCGYHDDPFFMEFEYFKKVVDSLHDFDGQIGIIGGEPTLHPDFVKMVEYIRDTYPYKKEKGFVRQPISDVNGYIFNNNVDDVGKFKLFTCAKTQQFYDNFELIDDVFESFRFNDHSQGTRHFTTLVDYKDLGLSDGEFKMLENDCWVQNYCFATVTPKGGFFCEMAGALDMLYGGDGGFEIKDGWWKRYRKDFECQEQWCAHCGARLGLPMRLDSENKDYVSKSVVDNLKHTKRIRNNDYKIITKEEYQKNWMKWREEKSKKLDLVDEICIDNNNPFFRPQHISFVNKYDDILKQDDWVVCGDYAGKEKYVLEFMNNHFFNIGCLYYMEDEPIFAINVKSNALKNLTKIDMNPWGYYDLQKIVKINNFEDDVLKATDEVMSVRGIMDVGIAKQKAELMKKIRDKMKCST